MPTFEEYQQQMQSQMAGNNGGAGQSAEMNQSVQDMAMAAQNMQMTAMSEKQQSQMMMRALQDTNSQISTLTQSIGQLTQEMRGQMMQSGPSAPMAPTLDAPAPMMASTPSAPMPPGPVLHGADQSNFGQQAWDKAAPVAKRAGSKFASYAGSTGQQWAHEAYSGAAGAAYQFRPNEEMQAGSEPGFLQAPQGVGVMRGTYQGMGLGFEHEQGRHYSLGAYKRAMQEGGAKSARNWAAGGMQFGQTMFGSAQTAIEGQAMGAVGGAAYGMLGGGLLGGAGAVGASMAMMPALAMAAPITGALDKVNPLSIGMDEMNRGAALASPVNEQSQRFLRGRMGRYKGHFNLGEQAEIGKGLRKETLKDLTFDTQDVQDMQSMMQDSGQFLGSQNSEDYVRRFKEAFDNAKTIMKSFQTTAKEAVGFMDKMYSDIGLQHGAEMAEFSGNLYSGAHLAGISPDQMMGVATQGARSAAGRGIMAPVGARNAIGAQALAGQAATHTMGADLLATMGGEQGLAQMLAGSQQQFMGGMGGTMLAAGGSFSGLEQGLQQTAGALGTQDDLLGFMANKHRRLQDQEEKLGSSGMQAQEFNMYSDMADQFGGGKDMMQTLVANQKFGGDTAKAEGWMKSMQALPEKMRREQDAKAQQRADMQEDLIDERYSIRGRVKFGFRDLQQNTLGGATVGDLATDVSTGIGEAYEHTARNMGDWVAGIRRDRFSNEDVNRIKDNKDEILDKLGAGGGGGSVDVDGYDVRQSLAGTSWESRGMRSNLRDAATSTSMGDMALGAAGMMYGGPLGKEAAGLIGEGMDTRSAIETGHQMRTGSEMSYGDMSQKQRQQAAEYASAGMSELGVEEEKINEFREEAELDTEKGFDIMSADEEAKMYTDIFGDVAGSHDEADVADTFRTEEVQKGIQLAQELTNTDKMSDKAKKTRMKIMGIYEGLEGHKKEIFKNALENAGFDINAEKGTVDEKRARKLKSIGESDRKIEEDRDDTFFGSMMPEGNGGLRGSDTTSGFDTGFWGTDRDKMDADFEKGRAQTNLRGGVKMINEGASSLGLKGNFINDKDGDVAGLKHSKLRNQLISNYESWLEDDDKSNDKIAELTKDFDAGRITSAQFSKDAEGMLMDMGGGAGERVGRAGASTSGLIGDDSTKNIVGIQSEQITVMNEMIARLEAMKDD